MRKRRNFSGVKIEHRNFIIIKCKITIHMSRDRCDFQSKKFKHNANEQHTNTQKLARSRIVFGSGSSRSRDLGYDIMEYYNSSRWTGSGWDSGGGCIEHRVYDIQRVPPLARCTIDRRGGSGGNGGGRGVAKNARNVFTPTTATASTLLPVTTTITTTLLLRYMYTILPYHYRYCHR